MTSTDATQHAGHAADDHGHKDHHVCDTKTFVGILLVLLFLTFITVLVSRFDFGGANMLIAMVVAAVKASLVIAVFMHMLWDTAINKLFFLCSFLFLGLLFLFIFADLVGRSSLEPKHGRAAPLDYKEMPRYEDDPMAFVDYGATKLFSLDEMGEGECAV